jgi:hypothetical protein
VSEPTDNATPNTTTPADVDFATQLQGLLDKLVPPDEVEVQLVGGARVVLPGAIPARRQIRVFRLMRELLELPQVQQGLQAGAGTSALVELVVGLATDEQVADLLGRMFSEAYPDALPEGHDPLDALPLEELAVALVPFTERFLQRLGRGMMVLTQVASS